MKARLTIATATITFGFMLVFTQSAFAAQDERLPASVEFENALSMARNDQDDATKSFLEKKTEKADHEENDGPQYMYEEDDAQ